MLSQQELQEQLTHFYQIIDLSDLNILKSQKKELEKLTLQQGFWDDSQRASQISKQIGDLNTKITQMENYLAMIDDLKVAFELQESQEFEKILGQLQKIYSQFKLKKFLNGQFDQKNALVTVQAGAGGVDAQDFAAMLVAMYQSFAKKQDWNSELIYLSVGEEGGVKNATLKISGNMAFGILKEEAGVHRLVRLSPFNSGNTRETSFAMVEVLPEGLDEEIEVVLKEEDLHWDYFMSSGKGGQSVNTTYSAVRVIHKPTGISASCQNERNQYQNKILALKYLKNKLAILEMKKQKQLVEEIRGDWQSAEWGNQIRSYIKHPYKLVKDHRSGYESQNVDKIFEGEEILDFIWSVKKHKSKIQNA